MKLNFEKLNTQMYFSRLKEQETPILEVMLHHTNTNHTRTHEIFSIKNRRKTLKKIKIKDLNKKINSFFTNFYLNQARKAI